MGLLDAISGGLEAAGGAIAGVGMEQMKASIESARQERLLEMQSRYRLEEDTTKRSRDKSDAEDERSRIAEFSRPEVSQANGLLSKSAGLNDADSIGADENIGSDVQNRMRPVSDDVASRRARDSGDLAAAEKLGKLDDKEAANATRMKIAELTNDAKFAKMDKDYQLGVFKLEKMLDKAEAAGKSPTQVQQIEYLIKGGMGREKAIALVYHSDAKVGEFTSTTTESTDNKGNKTVVTKKTKPGEEKPNPAGRVREYVDGKFVDR